MTNYQSTIYWQRGLLKCQRQSGPQWSKNAQPPQLPSRHHASAPELHRKGVISLAIAPLVSCQHLKSTGLNNRLVWSNFYFVFETFSVLFDSAGTTWMQQILVQIMAAAHPGWAQDATNRLNIPFLEKRNPFRERPDPRIFVSHLLPDTLPQDAKAKRNKVISNMQYPSIHLWPNSQTKEAHVSEINCDLATDHTYSTSVSFRLCMFGGIPRMSWCPFITFTTVGCRWIHLRALRNSFSSSWMVMVSSVSWSQFSFVNQKNRTVNRIIVD